LDDHGWTFREAGSGPRTVLLLPGALCTAAFYDDVLSEPAIAESGLRLVAATPPGFGGNPVPRGFDMGIDSYAALVEEQAERLGCDALVGHSLFANVLMQVASRGRFDGPLVLLSPCFSLEDEEKDFRQIERLSRVPGLGGLVFRLLPLMMSPSMKGRLPPARHKALVGEMKRVSPRLARAMIQRYFDHLVEPGSLAERLAESGTVAWVVRGDQDEVAITAAEAATLEAAATVTVVSIPGARHFSMTDDPAAVARVIVDAVEPRASSPA
jgi:pimeloyl-ACP methyl ester carboxylesterase